MIGIVDYGMGNLLSVYNAFDYLGEEIMICSHPEELNKADKIVIPGVGAFKDCIDLLSNNGFVEALNETVILDGKPTLGICLGMQVMAKKSYEFGEHFGLGWFDAEVVKIQISDPEKKLPNIGWNEIKINLDHVLFRKIPNFSDFYLVHSCYMECSNVQDRVASYLFDDQEITAAVLKDNIFATQFHPEKSQDHGLQLLENFIKWNP